MRVTLVVVPPGGGEADYSIPVEMPALPAAGDYLGISMPGALGLTSLIVKRTWWSIKAADNGLAVEAGKEKYGEVSEISVECYPARGQYDSEDHKRVVDMYAARGKGILEFDTSMY